MTVMEANNVVLFVIFVELLLQLLDHPESMALRIKRNWSIE